MKRSRSYPILDLEAAIALLRELEDVLQSAPVSRDAFARALGYEKGTNGLAARKIAALAHFGMLRNDTGSGTYHLTPLGNSLLATSTDQDLDEAFRHPQLYRELLARFRQNDRLPFSIEPAIRSLGVTAKASRDVERLFRISGAFAGVFDNDGVFLRPRTVAARESRTEAEIEGETEIVRFSIPLPSRAMARLALELPHNLTPSAYEKLKQRMARRLDELEDHFDSTEPENIPTAGTATVFEFSIPLPSGATAKPALTLSHHLTQPSHEKLKQRVMTRLDELEEHLDLAKPTNFTTAEITDIRSRRS